MNTFSNSESNRPIDWYQDVLKQPKVPMTLRVGCYNADKNSRFELYGEGEGTLGNLVLQIAELIHQCSQHSVAQKIYTNDLPIMRLVSRHAIEISQLENVQVECTTIYPFSDSSESVLGVENSSIDNSPNEHGSEPIHPSTENQRIAIKKSQVSSLVFDTSVVEQEPTDDFILQQISEHCDILIINAISLDTFDSQEYIKQNIELSNLDCCLVIRRDGTAELFSNRFDGSKVGLKGNSLEKELKLEFDQILLFASLLKLSSDGDNRDNLSVERIVEYANESALKYQSIEPDFEYLGPIDSLTSWISWHNIFRRFVSSLYSSSSDTKREKDTSATMHQSTKGTAKEKEPTKEKENLESQRANHNSHRLFAQFLRADHLAIRYANAHRSSFILIYCLGAFALINAAVAIGFSQIGWLALTSALAEFFALVGIFLIYRNDHKKRYHIKWLEYRSLAEMLRMAPLLNSIGMTPSTNGFERHRSHSESSNVNRPDTGRTWLIIYTQSLIRWVGFGQVKINHESLLSAKHFLSETILKGQLNYHNNNAHKMHVVGHNLGHFSYILFVLAFVFVSGKLITKLLAGLHLGIDYELLGGIGHALGVLAAVCPMLGSAAFAIRNHAEFDISSQRSLSMIKSLEQSTAEIQAMNQPTEYSELAKVVAKTSNFMQSETADWLEIYEVKETEPG
jgi:hypothetical protein